jgi:hypothetical protein
MEQYVKVRERQMYRVRNALASDTLLLIKPHLRAYASSRPVKERVRIRHSRRRPSRAIENRKTKTIKLMHASGYHESNVCVSGGVCSPPRLSQIILPKWKTPECLRASLDKRVAEGNPFLGTFSLPGRGSQ